MLIQLVYDVTLIPWIWSVNLEILREALTSGSNSAGPSGNSSSQNADNELGSCEDSADMEADGRGDDSNVVACSSPNLEPPTEPPVS